MENLGEPKPRTATGFAEIAARLIETGQMPIGGSNPELLLQHTANSIRNMLRLFEEDPEYAKTLGITAQGISTLTSAFEDALEVVSKFTNS